MNWFTVETILSIKDISENLKQFPDKFRIVTYSSCMYWRTIVRTLVSLKKSIFLKVVYESHISVKQIKMFMRKSKICKTWRT